LGAPAPPTPSPNKALPSGFYRCRSGEVTGAFIEIVPTPMPTLISDKALQCLLYYQGRFSNGSNKQTSRSDGRQAEAEATPMRDPPGANRRVNRFPRRLLHTRERGNAFVTG
jgi:hypothetical protein